MQFHMAPHCCNIDSVIRDSNIDEQAFGIRKYFSAPIREKSMVSDEDENSAGVVGVRPSFEASKI